MKILSVSFNSYVVITQKLHTSRLFKDESSTNGPDLAFFSLFNRTKRDVLEEMKDEPLTYSDIEDECEEKNGCDRDKCLILSPKSRAILLESNLILQDESSSDDNEDDDIIGPAHKDPLASDLALSTDDSSEDDDDLFSVGRRLKIDIPDDVSSITLLKGFPNVEDENSPSGSIKRGISEVVGSDRDARKVLRSLENF